MLHFRTLTTAAAGLLVGASIGLSAAAAKDLRLGGVHAPRSFETRGLERFAELVAEKSGGSLKVQVFPAGQLGTEVEMIENVMLGSQDMFGNAADWNQHLVKDYGIMGFPFAFSNPDHVRRYLESDIHAEIKERMIKDKGIRVLAENFYRPPRVLVTKQPVKSIDDLRGRKLRMADVETYLKTWQAFGATTTVLPWAESYLAMRTGVVDGMDSPLSSVYSQKFYQVAPHVTMTYHSVSPFNILISERTYQSLSEDQQKILDDAAHEAGDFFTAMVDEQLARDRALMEKEGAVFADIDRAPFMAKAAEIAKQFEDRGEWTRGLFERVQKL